jgi:hypothetical protein
MSRRSCPASATVRGCGPGGATGLVQDRGQPSKPGLGFGYPAGRGIELGFDLGALGRVGGIGRAPLAQPPPLGLGGNPEKLLALEVPGLALPDLLSEVGDGLLELRPGGGCLILGHA